jgi:integrase
MPRLTDSVPKYRKHKGTGQAVVTINGRDYYLGPHGTRASHLEYDRLISEWLASGRSIAYGVAKASLTITELIVAYMDHARIYYGDHSRSEYANMRNALRPLRELYGSQLAREFGPMQLKAVREKFIAAGNSRTYINQQIRNISRVFRWGTAEGLIPPDVPQALAMVAGLRKGHTTAPETQKVRPVDDATVEATLQHLSSVVRAMVELQRATGMRPGEICILRPCDIDRSSDVWEYCPASHKTANRERERIWYVGPLTSTWNE